MWYTKLSNEQILTSDYLDILYQGQNKLYGGYQLRKNYSHRLLASLGLLLVFGALIALLGLLSHKDVQIRATNTRPTVLSNLSVMAHPEVIPQPHRALAQPKAAPAKTVPIVTQNNKVNDAPKTVTNTNNDTPGPNEAPGNTGETANGPSGTTAGTGIAPVAPPPPAKPVIKTWAEEMPAPNFDMNEYLTANLRYPDPAREANVQGRVVIQFVVNEDGSISNVTVFRGIGAGCDQEALRVVAAMPRWKPGRQNGIPVKVSYLLPINFRLE